MFNNLLGGLDGGLESGDGTSLMPAKRVGSLLGEDKDDGDAAAASPARGKGKRGKGKGKNAEAKAKSASNGKGKGRKEPTAEAVVAKAAVKNKKCTTCLKSKPVDEFPADQGKCKRCRSTAPSLVKLAIKQNCTEWLSNLQESHPKEYALLLLEHQKHREELELDNGDDDAGRVAKKRKGGKIAGAPAFSLLEFKERLIARTGRRLQQNGAMMWKQEYIEDILIGEHRMITDFRDDHRVKS
jgi:hypothetical protein